MKRRKKEREWKGEEEKRCERGKEFVDILLVMEVVIIRIATRIAKSNQT